MADTLIRSSSSARLPIYFPGSPAGRASPAEASKAPVKRCLQAALALRAGSRLLPRAICGAARFTQWAMTDMPTIAAPGCGRGSAAPPLLRRLRLSGMPPAPSVAGSASHCWRRHAACRILRRPMRLPRSCRGPGQTPFNNPLRIAEQARTPRNETPLPLLIPLPEGAHAAPSRAAPADRRRRPGGGAAALLGGGLLPDRAAALPARVLPFPVVLAAGLRTQVHCAKHSRRHPAVARPRSIVAAIRRLWFCALAPEWHYCPFHGASACPAERTQRWRAPSRHVRLGPCTIVFPHAENAFGHRPTLS